MRILYKSGYILLTIFMIWFLYGQIVAEGMHRLVLWYIGAFFVIFFSIYFLSLFLYKKYQRFKIGFIMFNFLFLFAAFVYMDSKIGVNVSNMKYYLTFKEYKPLMYNRIIEKAKPFPVKETTTLELDIMKESYDANVKTYTTNFEESYVWDISKNGELNLTIALENELSDDNDAIFIHVYRKNRIQLIEKQLNNQHVETKITVPESKKGIYYIYIWTLAADKKPISAPKIKIVSNFN